MLASVREGRLVECLEDDVDLLFEQVAVGVRLQHRRAEGLHLARVIAAANAEDDAATGEVVGHGVVLGEAQRMPHRRDVEAAAELDALGQVGEVHRQHQDVGDDLVAFTLKVMFGQPEDVVAASIHQLRDARGFVEDSQQPLVRQPTVIDGRSGQTVVVQVDVAGKQTAKTSDHEDVMVARARTAAWYAVAPEGGG